jgi:multiple RNA-binding domain-containing protein 1
VNHQQASAAVAHFHRTFLGSQRISVELAKEKNAADLSRPWSRYSMGSSRNLQAREATGELTETELAERRDAEAAKLAAAEARREKRKGARAILDELATAAASNPELQQYLAVSRGSATRSWANDDGLAAGPATAAVLPPVRSAGGEGEESSSDPEPMPEAAASCAGSHPLAAAAAAGPRPDPVSGGDAWAQSRGAAEEEEDPCRLFVRNLDYDCNDEDLRAHFFSAVGTAPSSVHIPLDASTGRRWGIGFVEFVLPEHAQKARELLDNSQFRGRFIHVLPGKAPRQSDHSGPGGTTKLGQIAVADKRRQQEASSSTVWSALFARADAVVDAAARRLGVSKADILSNDAEDGDVAVRVAVAEAHAAEETRAFLSAQGVDLAALEKLTPESESRRRSTTIILVKNLPSDVGKSDLQQLFARYGDVARLVLPPSGLSALVEFFEPAHARNAFRGLAHRKVGAQHVPLYLEWAPTCSFTAPPPRQRVSTALESGTEAALPTADAALAVTASVHLRPVGTEVTPASLRSLLESSGVVGVLSVTIPTDSAKKPQGFAFASFPDAATADAAIAVVSRAGLRAGDGVAQLQAKRARSGADGAASASVHRLSKQTEKLGTKLVIKNIPFQAQMKELRRLTKQFGQVVALRIPSKAHDAAHRGFCFVEYATAEEAENAARMMRATHLYGRPLKVESATGTEDLGADAEVDDEAAPSSSTSATRKVTRAGSKRGLSSDKSGRRTKRAN